MLIQEPETDDPWRVTSFPPVSSADIPLGQAQPQPAIPAFPPAKPTRLTSLGVTPLDLQFGQWPRKSVPDELRDRLLGADGRQGYAVVDAALIANLDLRLQGRAPASACLFDGDAAENLGAVAPWLIELADEDEITRSLFTRAPSDQWLWDSGAAIFLRSDLGMDGVRRCLRKLTQVREEDAGAAVHWMFLRFWNPVFARYLLEYGSAAMQARLLAAGTMIIPDAPSDLVRIWEGGDAPLAGPVLLTRQDRHALELATMDDFASRVRDWLTGAYGGLPPQIDAHRFLVELCHHARNQLGLRSEREVSDYMAASWLLRQPVERVLDMTALPHEIPQATLARLHDIAWDMTRKPATEMV